MLVPSWRGATYDLHPADERRRDHATRPSQRSGGGRFGALVVNFANADMVGHTGKIPETVAAVETLDALLRATRRRRAREAGAVLIMTADHGNAEQMLDPQTGEPHTAHTTNPVPFVLCGGQGRPLRSGGSLADVAPTILAPSGTRGAQGDDGTGPAGDVESGFRSSPTLLRSLHEPRQERLSQASGGRAFPAFRPRGGRPLRDALLEPLLPDRHRLSPERTADRALSLPGPRAGRHLSRLRGRAPARHVRGRPQVVPGRRRRTPSPRPPPALPAARARSPSSPRRLTTTSSACSRREPGWKPVSAAPLFARCG